MSSDKTTRALRRFKRAVIRKARYGYYGGPSPGASAKDEQRRLGRLCTTAKGCSCWMCANERRVFGAPIRELREPLE